MDEKIKYVEECVPLVFSTEPMSYTWSHHTIVATIEQFSKFPLFNKITYKDKNGKPFDKIKFKTGNRENVFIYDPTNGKVNSAEIYYKPPENRPLLLGVEIAGKTTYSKFTELMNARNNLNVFSRDLHTKLIETLVEENDELNDMVTLRIDKKSPYSRIHLSSRRLGSSNFTQVYHTLKEKYKSKKDKTIIAVNKIGNINDMIILPGSLSTLQDVKRDNITVYFKQSGDHRNVPLLIKITKNGSEEFFDRKNIHERVWRKIQIKNHKNSKNLESRLESIYKLLFETIMVLIHKHEDYEMLTIEESKPTKDVPPQAKSAVPSKPTPVTKITSVNTKVKVKRCECPNIGSDYVYYQHDLTVYKQPKHQRGTDRPGSSSRSVIAYIFNVGINLSMNKAGGSRSKSVLSQDDEDDHKSPLIYDENNNHLNVFFYKGKTGVDSVPLMFNYSNHWFKPRSIDEYFVEWYKVDDLTDTGPSALKDPSRTKNQLDEVNKMLNRINLNFNIDNSSTTGTATVPSIRAFAVVNSGTTGFGGDNANLDQGFKGVKIFQGSGTSNSSGQYGIPAPYYLNSSYDVTRIYVTSQIFNEDKMFISYTHKTKNGYNIGPTCYRTKERVEGGVNKTTKAPRSTGNPTSGQGNVNNYYTNLYDRRIRGIESDLDGRVDVEAHAVTVYFFKEDTNHNYPLLAEYQGSNPRYQYYVLKHGKDNTLVSKQ